MLVNGCKQRFSKFVCLQWVQLTVCALGGAKSITTVDMSNIYSTGLQNLLLNDITGKQHKLIQADCLQWLAECTEQFDLIFVDPPTFSNSKRI